MSTVEVSVEVRNDGDVSVSSCSSAAMGKKGDGDGRKPAVAFTLIYVFVAYPVADIVCLVLLAAFSLQGLGRMANTWGI